MTLGTFGSWAEVIAHAMARGSIWYHAPLDIRPVAVYVTWRGSKPRKLRVHASGIAFWADAGHLALAYPLQ